MIDQKTIDKLEKMDKQDLQVFLNVLAGTAKEINDVNMEGKVAAKVIKNVFDKMASRV